MRHNKITFPILPPPRGGRIRGGHAYGVITPTLSSFGKLRTVSNADGVIEPLAGDHAHGVTASQNGSKRYFTRLI